MMDLTAETFEKLKGETFILLAFGGTGGDGQEYDHAEIPLTLEAVTAREPIRYPDTIERDEKGAAKLDDSGKRVIAKRGEPVPDLPTPFRVVFHAPDHMPLTDGDYTVKHPTLGTIEHLHLSREGVAKDHDLVCMEGTRQVTVKTQVQDHDCCVLSAYFG